MIIDWVKFLKQEKLFDDESPLFPSTKLSLNTNGQVQQDRNLTQVHGNQPHATEK